MIFNRMDLHVLLKKLVKRWEEKFKCYSFSLSEYHLTLKKEGEDEMTISFTFDSDVRLFATSFSRNNGLSYFEKEELQNDYLSYLKELGEEGFYRADQGEEEIAIGPGAQMIEEIVEVFKAKQDRDGYVVGTKHPFDTPLELRIRWSDKPFVFIITHDEYGNYDENTILYPIESTEAAKVLRESLEKEAASLEAFSEGVRQYVVTTYPDEATDLIGEVAIFKEHIDFNLKKIIGRYHIAYLGGDMFGYQSEYESPEQYFDIIKLDLPVFMAHERAREVIIDTLFSLDDYAYVESGNRYYFGGKSYTIRIDVEKNESVSPVRYRHRYDGLTKPEVFDSAEQMVAYAIKELRADITPKRLKTLYDPDHPRHLTRLQNMHSARSCQLYGEAAAIHQKLQTAFKDKREAGWISTPDKIHELAGLFMVRKNYKLHISETEEALNHLDVNNTILSAF
jgi:hypothetical protein